jgi:hypothetical protein
MGASVAIMISLFERADYGEAAASDEALQWGVEKGSGC